MSCKRQASTINKKTHEAMDRSTYVGMLREHRIEARATEKHRDAQGHTQQEAPGARRPQHMATRKV
eukprot:scaffold211438_cov28-Tisochrysis_lutea.AAC.1